VTNGAIRRPVNPAMLASIATRGRSNSFIRRFTSRPNAMTSRTQATAREEHSARSLTSIVSHTFWLKI